MRILFSTPSLVTYTTLYDFTPSCFREREALLRVEPGAFFSYSVFDGLRDFFQVYCFKSVFNGNSIIFNLHSIIGHNRHSDTKKEKASDKKYFFSYSYVIRELNEICSYDSETDIGISLCTNSYHIRFFHYGNRLVQNPNCRLLMMYCPFASVDEVHSQQLPQKSIPPQAPVVWL